MDLKVGRTIILFCALIVGAIECASVTGVEDKLHNRVIQGEKLSGKEHFEHEDGDDELVHDPDYDHEAFLGRDEAHEFDQLTPGEIGWTIIKLRK
jgi:hypothetical protein